MTLITFAVFLLFGVAGVLAETPVRDPCSITVCYNGGTCIRPYDRAICQCASGFGGDRCQNTVQVKGGGTCPSGPFQGELNCTKGCDNDFDCPDIMKCCNTNCQPQCTSQFIRDPCANFCYNGGTCNAPADAPSCNCTQGFTGERCQNSTSTCPPIKPGDFSVCGSTPCKTDKGCPTNQKCCGLACGGNYCINVEPTQTIPPSTPTPTTPPPPSPFLPCFAARCSAGFVCRNIVVCTNCSLTAKCIPPMDLAADIDKSCQSYGYSEAILLQSSKYSNSYSQLLCSARPSTSTNKCPTGSFCVQVGKRNRQCCAGKIDPASGY